MSVIKQVAGVVNKNQLVNDKVASDLLARQSRLFPQVISYWVRRGNINSVVSLQPNTNPQQFEAFLAEGNFEIVNRYLPPKENN